MLEIPTIAQLQTQAAQDLGAEASGRIRAALEIALSYALAALAYAWMLQLQYLGRQLFPDTAENSFALLWASVYGIAPIPAAQAQGTSQA